MQEKWVKEQKYEIAGDIKALGAPKKSRTSSSCKLFKGMKFYLLGMFSNPAKEELASLIETGEGELLKEPPKPPQV